MLKLLACELCLFEVRCFEGVNLLSFYPLLFTFGQPMLVAVLVCQL